MAWKQTRTLSSSARYHGEFQISSSNFLFKFLKDVRTAFPELRERDSLTLHVLPHHICCWLLPLLHRGTLIGRIGRSCSKRPCAATNAHKGRFFQRDRRRRLSVERRATTTISFRRYPHHTVGILSIPRTSKLSTPIRNAFHYLTDIPRLLYHQFDSDRLAQGIVTLQLVHFSPAATFVLLARLA